MAASNLYYSAGQPSDSTGIAGDFNFDTSNRVFWGPKTATTWVGTANSTVGPTGPAMLAGSSVPGSSLGNNGNGYTDVTTGLTYLKASNAWTQQGSILGPQGPAGVLGSTGSSPGLVAQATSVALSSTPQTMVVGNTTTPAVYQPLYGSAFLGCFVQTAATGTTTFTLYDLTASSSVYSITCGANTYAQSGSSFFAVTTYPLVTGHQYVWQISNPTSQTGGGSVFPYYSTPSGSAAPAVSMYPLIGLASSTSITSTSQQLPFFGGTQAAVLYPLRTAGCFSVIATLTATGSTATTATATINGTYTLISNGSSGNLTWSNTTLTANGKPQTVFSSTTDTNTFQNGYKFQYYVSASSTITATLQLQIYAYV